jgi:hypothetical protein
MLYPGRKYLEQVYARILFMLARGQACSSPAPITVKNRPLTGTNASAIS